MSEPASADDAEASKRMFASDICFLPLAKYNHNFVTVLACADRAARAQGGAGPARGSVDAEGRDGLTRIC